MAGPTAPVRRADCATLERLHNLRRSTLVLLDVVPEFGTPSYEQRRTLIQKIFSPDVVFSGDTSCAAPCDAVVPTTTMRAKSRADALAFYYQCLREAKRLLH